MLEPDIVLNETKTLIATNKISWLEKYRPQSLSDYYISKTQLDIVKTWIKEFRSATEDARPFLILYGTAGIGKTTLAHLIFKYYNYEIIECNASDTRTKKSIRETIGQISKVSVCTDDKNKFKQTAIIMDEIDGLAGGEISSVQELIDIVTKDKDSKTDVYLCPVICTTNSIKDKKLQPLIKQGIVLNINRPSDPDCIKLINKISKQENFTVPEHIKKDIIVKAYGDYRQIIMLLFSYYHSLYVNVSDTSIVLSTNQPLNPSIIPSTNQLIIPSTNTSFIPLSTTYPSTISIYEEENEHFEVIKKISTECETPLDKLNYFLTHKNRLEDICYMCSDDSNLYFMNFYINVIPIIVALQTKSNINTVNTKENLLSYYKLLKTIYDLLKDADLLNNSIFIDKNWELLEYFDALGIAFPLKILNDRNLICKIPEFQLAHHSQYNFMRQEQAMNKKKINVDYILTHESDITNIYYSIKLFKYKNSEKIKASESRSKKKKSTSTNEENKYHIDKTYSKLVDKIDELLS